MKVSLYVQLMRVTSSNLFLKYLESVLGGLVVRAQSQWLAGDSEFESCSPLDMADCLECLCIYPSIPVS